MNKREIKNIFGWLDEITVQKSPVDSFSNKSWDNWNSYMVHRFLSMNISYIDIVNFVQNINPQNKKEIYTIYREMIPKRKVWNKYIKNQNKKIKHVRHTDVYDEKNKPRENVTLSILNFITCNGGTIIKDKKYPSNENELLIFDNLNKHSVVVQTDTPTRIVLNIVTI